MSKKTFVVLSSVVFTIILIGIFIYRLYLLNSDTSGFYVLKTSDWMVYVLTFLPEISIITSIIAIYSRKSVGLVFTVISAFLVFFAFIGELLTKFVKLIDVYGNGSVPVACVPWLNIPVLIIVIILFVIKFRIYSLPNEIKIKLKLVNLC